MRSIQPRNAVCQSIDKNTFVDYVNLPGVVSDRFFALVSDPVNETVSLTAFTNLLLDVYSCKLEDKMRLVFRIFSFNQDNKVTPDEVRMILSYIPFSNDASTS